MVSCGFKRGRLGKRGAATRLCCDVETFRVEMGGKKECIESLDSGRSSGLHRV